MRAVFEKRNKSNSMCTHQQKKKKKNWKNLTENKLYGCMNGLTSTELLTLLIFMY